MSGKYQIEGQPNGDTDGSDEEVCSVAEEGESRRQIDPRVSEAEGGKGLLDEALLNTAERWDEWDGLGYDDSWELGLFDPRYY